MWAGRRAASGSGSAAGTGINCGGDCSESYLEQTPVTLTAVADTGSTFTGWNGAGCNGTGDCLVTMDGDKGVTATFTSYKLYLPFISRQSP